jgi:4-amino-4-deoxy-L-arabinose transferase-like glycosyltransferase
MSTTITCASEPAVCGTCGGAVPHIGGLLQRVLTVAAAGALWLIVGDCVVASAGYLTFKCGESWIDGAAYAAGHAIGLGLLVLLWQNAGLRRRLAALLTGVTPALSSARGLFIFIAAFTALRVAWVLLVPTQPTSDNAVYHGLATRLVETGVYDTAKHRAYWPPGYPVFLAALYAVFGPAILVAKLANVALAGLADLLTWRVVRTHAGPRAAVAALLLTALWPGRNLHVDVLSYDELVIALVLASFALLPSAATPGAWPRWIAGGIVLGLACLVRPTLGLIPLAVGGWLLVRQFSLRQAVLCTAVYGLAMLAPVVPWTVRNYVVLHHFVPLTTNAGGNFYNSWAPGGTGCFYKPAWDHLQTVTNGDELKLSPTGFALGLTAIREDPAGAAWRVAQKQVHYLGSDNWLPPVETYIAAFGGRTALGTAVKLGVHTLTNAWFVLLLLAPILVARNLARRFADCPLAWLCTAVFVLGLLTHTVFEAQARYHLAYLPCWSVVLGVLVATAATSAESRSVASTASPWGTF